MAEKEITIEIKKPEVLILLVLISFFFILNLKVTFTTPIAFGDEGFHTRLAQLIAKEKEYFVYLPIENTNLTKSTYNRPPLWNLLEASFFLIFGFSEAIVKFLTPFIAFLTGIATFLLVKRLYNEKVGFVASIIVVTVPSFVTYSVLYYTDVLMTFLVTLSILLFILATKEDSKKYFLLSAIFGGLAYLTKAPALAIYLFAGLAFLYELATERKILFLIKKYGFFVLILVLVSAGFFIRNYKYFETPTCYVIPIKQLAIFNTSKCSINLFQPKYQFGGRVAPTGTEQTVYSMGIINYLNFAYGNIFFVIFGFICGFLILLFKRDKTTDFLLIYFILFLALFPLVTSRAEDTARYTLGWVFLFALLAGKFFDEFYEFVKKYFKQFALIIFVLVIVASYFNISGKLDIMFRVKQFSPAFFEACDWVKNNLPENVSLYTVWAHRAVYNCQRDAVATTAASDIALSKDVNYTLALAKQLGITHLFVQKFSIDPQNNHYAENYDLDWVQFLEDNPKAFVKIYENGPSFDLTNRSVRDWVYYCYQRIGTICDGNVIYELNFTAL